LRATIRHRISQPPYRDADVNSRAIKIAEWIVAILLSGAVLFVFFVRATHAGALWRDECDSVELARMPTFADVLHNLKFTSFPILFPATIRLFTNLFGTSDATLRAFGFLIGVAFIIVAWFNARTNRGEVPLLLPALAGLNLTFLTDGTWIRGYGLGSVLLILAFALTAMFVARPSVVRLIAAFIAYIVCMQSLYFTAALVPALLLAAFAIFLFRRQFKWALGVCVVAAICAVSYIPQLLTYREIKDWTILLRYPITPQLIWKEFLIACGNPVPFVGIVWLALASMSILGAAIILVRRTDRAQFGTAPLFALLTIAIATTTYYTFLGITHTAPQTRYHIAYLCLLAAALELIVTALCLYPFVRIARLLVVVALGIFLPITAWSRITQRETTVDLLAKNLERYAAAEDLIVVNPWFLGPSFSWYYHGTTRWMTLPELSEKRIHRYDQIKTKMEQTDAIADLKQAIMKTLQSGNRVWLVGGAQPTEQNGPLSLAPAPDPVFAWSSQAYTYAWSMQIGAFVQQHVVDGEVVLTPAKQVSINENIPLVIARGWRD
jgi:hypothetical protein